MADTQTKSKGLGIAGFILGLLSVILIFTGTLAIIFGILGLIFSIIQIKKNKTKLAVAGLVLSIIGIVLAIVTLIIIFVVLTQVASNVRSGTQGLEAQANCIGINLEILSVDASKNEVIIAGISHPLVQGVWVFKNQEVVQKIPKETLRQQIILDINFGDEVSIAPVLGDGTVCAMSDPQIVG